MPRRDLVAFVMGMALACGAGGCSLDTSATLPDDAGAVGDTAVRPPHDADPAGDTAVPRDTAVRPPGDAQPDVDAAADVGTDSGAPESPCPLWSADVVALYTFEETAGTATVPDVVGAHDGQVQSGPVSTRPGPGGCGQALDILASARTHVAIPDSGAWDLPVGSADFWFLRVAGAAAPAGLLTRDAQNRNYPGHLRIIIDEGGRLFLRLQRVDSIDVVGPSPSSRQWHHVGVNWGPGGLELWLDGLRVASADVDWGIDGNDNAWVIGGDTSNAVENTFPPEDVRRISTNTGIDHVRISSVRRDFSAYAALAPDAP